MRQPRFLYFDLGNVLLNFDHRLGCRQVSAVSGVPADRVWDVVFESQLEWRYEAGEFGDREFYETFCRETGTRCDYEAFLRAGSAIFTPNRSIVPLIAALDAAGYRLGILSNICASHWAYVSDGRYGLINQAFDTYALSYELGACKPASKIFEGAARLVGLPPEEIFFTDDIAGHVAGAKTLGYDAVQYTTTPALVAELHSRGIEFNY